MKILKALFVLLLVILIPASAMAVEGCTAALKSWGWLQLSWTAAAAGTFTSTICSPAYPIDGWVTHVQVDPGGTAPQALYDITLTDSFGEDISDGGLADLSATVTNTIDIGARPVYGPLTLNISGNNVNSANGVVNIYFVPF